MGVRREQQLPLLRPTLERRYGLMAESLLFQTNDPNLLAAADASFSRFALPTDDRPPLVVSLFSEAPREGRGEGEPQAAQVAYRVHGDHYLITRAHEVAIVDGARGVAWGTVSTATAADQAAVRYSFIEAMSLSMLGRNRGYLTLHAAGVVRNGIALVLGGPAGSGKSTLAMACARRGFGVFAEDAVYARVLPASIELWGMPWTQRLLPDTRGLFPEITGIERRRQPNGEVKLEVDLDSVFPGRAVPCAPAGPLVDVARGTGGPTRIEPIEADLHLLWPWDGGWSPELKRSADRMAAQPRYRMHMNDTPDAAVDALEALVEELGGPATRG
jgi:hypothetical protein